MSNSLQITCPSSSSNDTSWGWPVSDANELFMGFTDNSLHLEPIKRQMIKIGEIIAQNFAQRFENGETRSLIKCRKTESAAISFIMVSLTKNSLLQINQL